MYIPEAFNNTSELNAFDFIEKNNFADIVTANNNQLQSNKLPLLLDREERILFGHIARANPQLQQLGNSNEVLVIFSGPHAYISPQWYLSQNMVPTWNFQTAQVRGKAELVDGQKLTEILSRLTHFHESLLPEQWSPDNIDLNVRNKMLKMIVGFQIKIDDIQFKEKLSQNRNKADCESVIDSLLKQNDPVENKLAQLMADKLG